MIVQLQAVCWCPPVTMNFLEDVPFQTQLGPLEEEVQLLTAPDITVQDCQQLMKETEVSQVIIHIFSEMNVISFNFMYSFF